MHRGDPAGFATTATHCADTKIMTGKSYVNFFRLFLQAAGNYLATLLKIRINLIIKLMQF